MAYKWVPVTRPHEAFMYNAKAYNELLLSLLLLFMQPTDLMIG